MKKTNINKLSILGLAFLLCACAPNVNNSATNSENESTNSSEITTENNPSNESGSDSSSTHVSVAISKLKIISKPTKLNYKVNEKFDSNGLKVNLVTTKDGEEISNEEVTNYILTYNDGETLTNNTVLSEGEYEVMVSMEDENIRSTSFNIKVVVSQSLAPLHEVVQSLVTGNNFTVANTIGGDNHVKGLHTKDAMIWDSDEEAYFMDEGWGYGTHDNKTFRYKLENNQVVNANYIEDLGPKAEDHGLFSPLTLDDLAERRVSNYNIQGITSEDMSYLKGLKPTSDNPNRYKIDMYHCKWLFNAIGHTQLCNRPDFFLNGASIILEVKADGLYVDLITLDTFDGVNGCVAKIYDIGTTVIPGMKEFLANPVFGEKVSLLDKMQEAINSEHYSIMGNTTTTVVTPNYVYGDHLGNYNAINVKENNKVNKEPGYYHVSIADGQVSLGNLMNKNESAYPTRFDLFKNMSKYFVQDTLMNNKYVYTLTDELEATSNLKDFVKIYHSNYQDSMEILNVSLDSITVGDNLYQITLNINTANEDLEPLLIQEFSLAANETIDSFVSTLY